MGEITPTVDARGEGTESENDIRELIEHVPVAWHWIAPDGTILWANQADLDLAGCDRSEYIGANIARFHADDEIVVKMLDRLRQGEELRNYEARLRRKNGLIRHVTIDSNSVFRNGELVYASCLTRDITGLKSTASPRERLAAIVECSDDAIISKDLNGIVQSWNRGAERIFGYTAEEAIGRHISMIAAPDRVDEIPNILARIARGERIDHFQTKRKTKDGRLLSISLTVSPIRDESGRIIGASKVARDVSDRSRYEEALRAANESLRRSNADLEHFAYSASHDLQEPLRMVASYSDLLRMRFAGKLGTTGDEYLRYIVEGALRMESLLRDLRVYVQVSSVSPEPPQEIEATAALESALANLEKAISDSGASITYTTLPRVHIRSFQLQQLFQNLIGNAIHYRGEERPKVQIAAERRGGEWMFSIQDNGIGIDPAYKEQIFGIFKRLHTTAKYPGTGMGLAICERIVERARGRLWVESEPGRGSTFFFTLPAEGQ